MFSACEGLELRRVQGTLWEPHSGQLLLSFPWGCRLAPGPQPRLTEAVMGQRWKKFLIFSSCVLFNEGLYS